jgi:DNA-directed RNA polymerase beta' subunit
MDKRDLLEVTSYKLFTDTFFKVIDQNGLISERIFGPTKSYKCTCGKLISKIINDGRTCDVCGVQCISNESRYYTYAKITLPFPILNKLKIQKLYKLVGLKNKHLLDPIQNDRNTYSNYYLQYDEENDEIKIVTDYDNYTCIPLIINSLFTLYLGLKTIELKYSSSIASEYLSYFFTELLVIPPNSRQTVVMNDNGSAKLIMSELDRLYIKVIKLNKYIVDKLNLTTTNIIDEYLALLVDSIELHLSNPILDDVILEINDLNSKIQYYCNQVYDIVTSRLSGKEGLIRRSYMGFSKSNAALHSNMY